MVQGAASTTNARLLTNPSTTLPESSAQPIISALQNLSREVNTSASENNDSGPKRILAANSSLSALASPFRPSITMSQTPLSTGQTLVPYNANPAHGNPFSFGQHQYGQYGNNMVARHGQAQNLIIGPGDQPVYNDDGKLIKIMRKQRVAVLNQNMNITVTPSPSLLLLQSPQPHPFEQVMSLLPFVKNSDMFVPPGQTGVLHISNMKYGATREEILAIFGRTSRVMNDRDEPVHIVMDRVNGKTMDAYVEFFSHTDALNALEKLNASQRPPKIGDRAVTVVISNNTELQGALFPRARGARWENGTPVLAFVREDEPFNRFKCIMSPEEICGIERWCLSPERCPFTKSCPQRPYEAWISTLRRFPWHASKFYTVHEQYRIYRVTENIIHHLASIVQLGEPKPPHFDPSSGGINMHNKLSMSLLRRLALTAIECPGFSVLQKDNLVAILLAYNIEVVYTAVRDADSYWFLRGVSPRADAPLDVVDWFVHQIKRLTEEWHLALPSYLIKADNDYFHKCIPGQEPDRIDAFGYLFAYIGYPFPDPDKETLWSLTMADLAEREFQAIVLFLKAGFPAYATGVPCVKVEHISHPRGPPRGTADEIDISALEPLEFDFSPEEKYGMSERQLSKMPASEHVEIGDDIYSNSPPEATACSSAMRTSGVATHTSGGGAIAANSSGGSVGASATRLAPSQMPSTALGDPQHQTQQPFSTLPPAPSTLPRRPPKGKTPPPKVSRSYLKPPSQSQNAMASVWGGTISATPAHSSVPAHLGPQQQDQGANRRQSSGAASTHSNAGSTSMQQSPFLPRSQAQQGVGGSKDTLQGNNMGSIVGGNIITPNIPKSISMHQMPMFTEGIPIRTSRPLPSIPAYPSASTKSSSLTLLPDFKKLSLNSGGSGEKQAFTFPKTTVDSIVKHDVSASSAAAATDSGANKGMLTSATQPGATPTMGTTATSTSMTGKKFTMPTSISMPSMPSLSNLDNGLLQAVRQSQMSPLNRAFGTATTATTTPSTWQQQTVGNSTPTTTGLPTITDPTDLGSGRDNSGAGGEELLSSSSSSSSEEGGVRLADFEEPLESVASVPRTTLSYATAVSRGGQQNSASTTKATTASGPRHPGGSGGTMMRTQAGHSTPPRAAYGSSAQMSTRSSTRNWRAGAGPTGTSASSIGTGGAGPSSVGNVRGGGASAGRSSGPGRTGGGGGSSSTGAAASGSRRGTRTNRRAGGGGANMGNNEPESIVMMKRKHN